MKHVRRWISLLLVAVMIVGMLPTFYVFAASNEETIFVYLITNMGLNKAAACGVLANIEHESNFNPTIVGDYGTSYGICQWHNERYTALINYCNSKGYDYRTLNGQLHYLQYELEGSYYKNAVLNRLKAVANSADGAYQAAEAWCRYFEVPANVDYQVSIRGASAKNTYWPRYQNYSTIPDYYYNEIVFNVAFYRSANSDLASKTDAQLKEHWGNYGVKEGRRASAAFDVKWYLNNHSDLKNAYGATGYANALKHFVENGVKEGRAGSADFNFANYKFNYNDLANSYGSDNAAYYKHFNKSGYAEGRIAHLKLKKISDGEYTIGAWDTRSLLVEIKGQSKDDGVMAQVWEDYSGDCQKFIFRNAEHGAFYIYNVHTGKYLTANGDNFPIIQKPKSGGKEQMWYVVDLGDGACSIVNKGNKKFMDLSNNDQVNGTTVGVWKSNNSNAQKWELKLIPILKSGVYTICSKADEKFGLDIAAVSQDNSANLHLYTYKNGENQRFAVYRNAEGYYTIRALHSNKCLDVAGGATATGTNVAQYTDNGTAAQLWSVVPNTDGSYSFVSKCNALYLDVNGGTIADESNIQCWTGNETVAQKWVMKRVASNQIKPEGLYHILSSIDQSFAAANNNGNIETAQKSDSMAQAFEFTALDDGCYTITNKKTGEYVSSASSIGTSTTLTDAEKWQLMPNADKTVSIVNVGSGQFFNLRGGKAGANIDIFPYYSATDAASKWILEEIEHIHAYTNVVTAPTCTEKGYTTYTCTECGSTYQDNYVDATGHKAVTDPAKSATCTAAGKTEGSHCSVCSLTLVAQQTIAALGHAWDNGTVEAATCTKNGAKTYHCTRCAETRTETIPATGHKAVTDNGRSAACTEDGLTQGSHCSNCGITLVSQQPIPALGHEWNDGETIVDPVCPGASTIRFTCRRCGETETKAGSSSGHTVVNDPAENATCVKQGKTAGSHCAACGAVIVAQQSTPALGHEWNSGYTTLLPTCTETGTQVYNCTRCGEGKTESIAAKGHTAVIDPAQAPTCTENGRTEGSHCAVCGVVIVESQFQRATGHSYIYFAHQDSAEFTNGYDQFICTSCGDIYQIDIPAIECPSSAYQDVKRTGWYHESVDFMVNHGYMFGMGENYFGLNENVTRGQFTTILYRIIGEPSVEGLEIPFTDVKSGDYYYNAIRWAYNNQVVSGTTETTFSPKKSITREQLASILYRYVGSPAASTAAIEAFPDKAKVSSYAVDAVSWAVNAGLLSGNSISGVAYLQPKNNAPRVQSASLLYRFVTNILQ